tara:strand:- start:9310 stop:10452 length:1143 start_codon:yes stop_codon:yes gene_type:complete
MIGVPLLICLVCLISFKFSNYFRILLLHTFIGIVLSLFFWEYRLIQSVSSRFENQKNISIESPYEHITSNKEKVVFTTGESIRRRYRLPFYKFGGKSFSNTVLCNEAGELISYKSDRYGFNNVDSKWDSDNPKIIILGDSFIHGICQSKGNSIADRLQSANMDKDVINLGLSGNGILSNLGILSEYINELNKVEKIIYFHYEGNDLSPNLASELKRRELTNYLRGQTQDLINKQQDIDRIMQVHNDDAIKKISNPLNANISFFRFSQLRELISRSLDNMNINYDVFNDALNIIIDKSKSLNSEFIFVYIPDSRSFENNRLHSSARTTVNNLVENKGLNYINLYKTFRRSNSPLENYFFIGSHLSDKGSLNVVENIMHRYP